jgi:multidrug transporter EmrE-like cation transporter
MYSAKVSFIIGGMVLTGAARSVTAKLFFQLGFNYPLFLTLLYLAGQSLSLIPYNIWVWLRKSGYEFVWDEQTLFPRLKRQSPPDHSRISDSSKRSYRSRPSLADHANPDWEEEKEEEENNQSALQLPSLTYDTEQGQGETSTLDRIDIEEKDQNEDHSNQRRKSSVTFAVSDDNSAQMKASSDYHIIDIEENQNVVEGQKRRKSSVRFSSDEPTSQNNSSALIEETNGCDDDNNDNTKEVQHVGSNSSSTSLDPFAQKNGGNKNGPNQFRLSQMSSRTFASIRRVSESIHGLPKYSRTKHLHQKIPWYLKPAVPALFNLLNSAMRWASLVFVAASVAEMLISGMELVLSVCATRLIRGRKVTYVRWLGVFVVTAGIVLVGFFDTNNVAQGETNDNTTANQQVIGIALILGQSIMSVFQDLTEEVFMQEAAFPPALLVVSFIQCVCVIRCFHFHSFMCN